MSSLSTAYSLHTAVAEQGLSTPGCGKSLGWGREAQTARLSQRPVAGSVPWKLLASPGTAAPCKVQLLSRLWLASHLTSLHPWQVSWQAVVLCDNVCHFVLYSTACGQQCHWVWPAVFDDSCSGCVVILGPLCTSVLQPLHMASILCSSVCCVWSMSYGQWYAWITTAMGRPSSISQWHTFVSFRWC